MSRQKDIVWGARNGVLIGGIYALFVLILYAVDGPRRFDKIDVTLGSLLALYLLGGLTAGIVLGAFRSALSQRYSAFVVSVLAAIPVAIGTTVLVTSNGNNWTMKEWSVSAFMALFIAGVGMAVFWQAPDDIGAGE